MLNVNDMTLFDPLRRAHARLVGLLESLQPLAQLAARLFVAKVFFLSGLTKLRDWEITVALFTDEYHVPLLSPEVAAAMGTAGGTGPAGAAGAWPRRAARGAGAVGRQRRGGAERARDAGAGAGAARVLGQPAGGAGAVGAGALVAGCVVRA